MWIEIPINLKDETITMLINLNQCYAISRSESSGKDFYYIKFEMTDHDSDIKTAVFSTQKERDEAYKRILTGINRANAKEGFTFHS